MGFTYTMASTKFQTLTYLTETQMSWIRCLLRVRTQSRSNLGISPYEMMFGLPFLISTHEVVAYEEGEINVIKYVKTIAQKKTRNDSPNYPSRLKDTSHKTWGWVLIKSWNEPPLIA